MRTYRFFLRHTSKLVENEPFTLDDTSEPEIFFQMAKVLRIKEGDKIVLLPAKKESDKTIEYHYEVDTIQKHTVGLLFKETKENVNELKFSLELTLCLPNKPEKLELILQKAVELGVTHIHVVHGDHSQFKHTIRKDRLEKIILEAAEQSERGVIPTFSEEGMLTHYLETCDAEKRKNIYVAMERSVGHFDPVLAKKTSNILIGPEGGFSESEKETIRKLNLHCFSLGHRILRMETAAILAMGLASLSQL